MLLFAFKAKERERGRKREGSLRKEKRGEGKKGRREGERKKGGGQPVPGSTHKRWQWVLLVWSWGTGDTGGNRLTLGSCTI